PCNLCGTQENLQRAMINDMLREWDRKYPGRLDSIYTATQNIAPSQLGDRSLFDFEGLEEKRVVVEKPALKAGQLPVVNITLI
ncbi:MAG: tRNA 2-thiocytidine(32) synthetase TtcA, partial [Paraperlucidibaca sp.]